MKSVIKRMSHQMPDDELANFLAYTIKLEVLKKALDIKSTVLEGINKDVAVLGTCSKCKGTGYVKYYYDAGDHFGAGSAPSSGWITEQCPICIGSTDD